MLKPILAFLLAVCAVAPAFAAPPTAESLADQEPILVLAPPQPPFELRAGETLRDTLIRWTDAAGYQLVWSAGQDYPVEVTTTFPSGTTFREALTTLLQAYWHKSYGIEGRLYENKVLQVVGRSQ